MRTRLAFKFRRCCAHGWETLEKWVGVFGQVVEEFLRFYHSLVSSPNSVESRILSLNRPFPARDSIPVEDESTDVDGW